MGSEMCIRDSGGTSDSEQANSDFREKMSRYLVNFNDSLLNLTLGQIALTEFEFPAL